MMCCWPFTHFDRTVMSKTWCEWKRETLKDLGPESNLGPRRNSKVRRPSVAFLDVALDVWFSPRVTFSHFHCSQLVLKTCWGKPFLFFPPFYLLSWSCTVGRTDTKSMSSEKVTKSHQVTAVRHRERAAGVFYAKRQILYQFLGIWHFLSLSACVMVYVTLAKPTNSLSLWSI